MLFFDEIVMQYINIAKYSEDYRVKVSSIITMMRIRDSWIHFVSSRRYSQNPWLDESEEKKTIVWKRNNYFWYVIFNEETILRARVNYKKKWFRYQWTWRLQRELRHDSYQFNYIETYAREEHWQSSLLELSRDDQKQIFSWRIPSLNILIISTSVMNRKMS